jgi:hypothetical protein
MGAQQFDWSFEVPLKLTDTVDTYIHTARKCWGEGWGFRLRIAGNLCTFTRLLDRIILVACARTTYFISLVLIFRKVCNTLPSAMYQEPIPVLAHGSHGYVLSTWSRLFGKLFERDQRSSSSHHRVCPPKIHNKQKNKSSEVESSF